MCEATIDDLEPVWVLELDVPEWGNEIQDEFKSKVRTMSATYIYLRESQKTWKLISSCSTGVEWRANDGTVLMAHVRYKHK